MVANFLLRGHVRRVTIKQPQATSSTSMTSTYRTQDMTKHDLLAILNQPRARSQSPQKRDRPTELDNDNDGENGDDAENDNDMDTGPRTKRTRQNSNSRLPSQTPKLCSTHSIPSFSSSSPENPTHERRRLAALRHSALLHQRPSPDRRDLICCELQCCRTRLGGWHDRVEGVGRYFSLLGMFGRRKGKGRRRRCLPQQLRMLCKS